MRWSSLVPVTGVEGRQLLLVTPCQLLALLFLALKQFTQFRIIFERIRRGCGCR